MRDFHPYALGYSELQLRKRKGQYNKGDGVTK